MARLETKLLYTLMGLALSSCMAGASSGERQMAFEAALQDYIGQNSDALLLRYGPPTQVVPMSQGGRLFSYSREEARLSGGGTFTAYDTVRQKREVLDADGTVRTVEEKVQIPVERQRDITRTTLRCNIRWQLDNDDVVQAVAWDGNDCF
ncbi:MAG: hypothetical protein ACFBZ9_18240 [Sphingomonadales bacterium]